MKVIITGGAGFIGSNLARALVAEGHGVTIVDNLSTGQLKNLRGIRQDISFVKGDIRQFGILEKAFAGGDYVLHHAALVSVLESTKNPRTCNHINVTGTLNVLHAALKNGIKKVVFASSAAVYGDTKSKGKIDENTPLNPISPYALSKIIGENYCKFYTNTYNIPTVILGYFNVYGPYQNALSDYTTVVPLFFKQLAAGMPPVIYGSGEQTRDFVYIDDVVNANSKAMRASKKAYGKVFNIGTGESISVRHLAKTMTELIPHYDPVALQYQPRRKGDILHSLADIRKAKRLLKYKPKVDLHNGLERYIKFKISN